MDGLPRWVRTALRVFGAALILGAMAPFWEALRSLDRREFVSSFLSVAVGWFVLQAGVELVRPESAE
jgi:hypothetical protein